MTNGGGQHDDAKKPESKSPQQDSATAEPKRQANSPRQT